MMTFLLRTLGASEIEAPDGTPCDLPPGKPFALLVHLVMERRPVRRDALARLLWPTAPREKALQSVRQAVWLVRQALGEESIVGGDPLEASRAHVETDVDRLRAALASGRVADALELWRGGFLERMAMSGVPEWDAWVDETGDRVARDFAAALHRAALTERAAGRADAALDLLDRAVELDRLELTYRLQRIDLLIELRELDRAGLALSEARRDLPEPEFAASLDAVDARLREALHRRGGSQDGLVRPEFVGRAAELADLLRLWRTAAAGRVRLALLSGPTGIGKTRLAEELQAAAEVERGRVVAIKATDAERTLELGFAALLARRLLVMPGSRGVSGASDALLRAMLPSLGSDAAPTEPGTTHPTAFADALLDLLGAVSFEAPLLVVLDDLHWADPASLAVIARVLRQARAEPILFVITWRPADLPAGAERTLEHLAREETSSALRLRPLSPGEVAEMLALLVEFSDPGAAGRIVERLHAATDGNPLFVVETLQALVEQDVLEWQHERWLLHVARIPESFPLPRSLESVIQGRLDRLSEDAARVVAALGNLPPRSSVNELRRAAAAEEDHFVRAIGELVERDIARWQEGRLEFSHDQQREAVVRRWGGLHRAGTGKRRQRLITAAATTALLATGGAAMSSVLAPPPEPLWGGGEVYLWFSDTALVAEPPRERDGEWVVRPMNEPVPPGGAGRIKGPFLLATGERRWYRTRTDPDVSPYVVEWAPNGTERTIAQSLRHDAAAGDPSPDGRFVAYAIDDSTTTAYDVGMVIADADGSNARRAFAGRSGEGGWSPDGDWYLLHRQSETADTAVLVSPTLQRGASLALPRHSMTRWCGRDRVLLWHQEADSVHVRFWQPSTATVTPFDGRAPDVPMIECSPDGRVMIGPIIVEDHLETGVFDTETGERLPFAIGERGQIDNVAWVPGAPATVIADVQVTEPPDTLDWGEQAVLHAVAVDHAGRRLAEPIAWRALDPGIVGVRSDGTVTANRPGTGRVEAIAGVWRADTVAIHVSSEIDESDEVIFFERFETLDPERWMVVGEPASYPVVRDGEPALMIPGDGNYADGISITEPIRFPRGMTVELEFRLPVTGAPNQYLNVHLLDGELAVRPPGTTEDWHFGSTIIAKVPAVPEVSSGLTAGLSIDRINASFDLPGEPDFSQWHRLGMRVQPDGTVSVTFDGEDLGQGRMRIRDFGTREWWIVIVGAAQETELLVRNVRVWGVPR